MDLFLYFYLRYSTKYNPSTANKCTQSPPIAVNKPPPTHLLLCILVEPLHLTVECYNPGNSVHKTSKLQE